MTSDFLDASFLVTVSITMYVPCYGFRDNDRFFSLDRFLVFAGSCLALIIRTILLFSGVDPLSWDSYCHAASACICFVVFVEVLSKWRKAVYGRSRLVTSLGRILPEDRESRRRPSTARNGATRPPLDGRAPLPIENNAQADVAGETALDTAGDTAASQLFTCRFFMGKMCHFFYPGLLVLFISADDGQSVASKTLAHDGLDMALGQSVGLVLSTLIAVLIGGFLKWYLYDTHLLFYMSLIFFAMMVISVQGSFVAMVRQDLPRAPEVIEGRSPNFTWV